MKKTMVLSVTALVLLLSSCGTYAGAGAYAGAGLGSILGSAIGGIAGGWRGSDVGAIVGMAGGAILGAAIGQKPTTETAARCTSTTGACRRTRRVASILMPGRMPTKCTTLTTAIVLRRRRVRLVMCRATMPAISRAAATTTVSLLSMRRIAEMTV